jgi:protein-L-isoaspartate(D-aspartate) O-methyltransferase
MTAAELEAARMLVLLLILLALLLVSALAASGRTKTGRQMQMVERDIRGRGISDPAVLRAMASVQRHLFVDASCRDRAYGDHPLPIGEGQTISQPFMVALMTEVLRLKPSDRVLEIGTGSGYQAAVLATIVKEVYTIEIVIPLAERARTLLAELGYGNVTVKFGDGYRGWEEQAPFDAIIITAAADRIPPPLIDKLKDSGRLVMPLGRTVFFQTLVVATKRNGTLTVRELAPVAFVQMTGEAEKQG